METKTDNKTKSRPIIPAHTKAVDTVDPDAEYREMIDRHEDIEAMESLRFEYDGHNPVQ